MADEYIKRNELLERINEIHDCSDIVFEPDDHCCQTDDCASCKWAETRDAIRRIVEKFPSADVRPVVHGEPIPKYEMIMNTESGCVKKILIGFICPFCGDDGVKAFCPNCGADMRGES